MATVNKPILLDETGKDMAAAIREQTEILSRATITMNPADYIVDCEYVEGEVEITKTNEAGETVTETITAVTSWHERYASGWVRQGGLCMEANEETGSSEFILHVPMANILYKVTLESTINSFDAPNIIFLDNRTTTSFYGGVAILMGSLSALPWIWSVEGMGAKL